MSHNHYWRTALLLSWLGNSLVASAQQSPELTRPVRLPPGRRPLGAVLAELSRQGRVSFSYSSSLVPLAHRYLVRPGPARPAGSVLREVLASEHLAYGWLGGQLVLWPDRLPSPAGVTPGKGEPTSTDNILEPQAAPALRSLLRPSLASTPGSLVRTESVALRAAKKAASRSAVKPLPKDEFKLGSTSLPATLAARNQVSISTKRLVPLPANKRAGVLGVLTYTSSATAAPKPRIMLPAVLPAAAVPGFQPSHSRRYQVGNRTSNIPGLASPLNKSLAKTPYFAAANAPALAQLPLKSVSLPSTTQVSEGPPLSLPASRAELAATPTAPPIPDRPLGLDSRWKGNLYLHGEAWASESLPVGLVGKVGLPRAYLVLGGAVASSNHHVGGAWGVGVGTVGRARGRFTPSLDLMQWFLGKDQDIGSTYLTQLRPLLAWQFKRTGRWALVLGPTLNLATAADSRGAQRNDFGHDQWLWLDGGDEHSSVRLWPGAQIGLRF